MRAPEAAGNDIAVFTQEGAVGYDTRAQQFGAFGNFTFHFQKQGVADVLIERGCIGMPSGGARHGDATAGAFMQTEGVGGPRKLQVAY